MKQKYAVVRKSRKKQYQNDRGTAMLHSSHVIEIAYFLVKAKGQNLE